jgi:hypothetical protein
MMLFSVASCRKLEKYAKAADLNAIIMYYQESIVFVSGAS